MSITPESSISTDSNESSASVTTMIKDSDVFAEGPSKNEISESPMS